MIVVSRDPVVDPQRAGVGARRNSSSGWKSASLFLRIRGPRSYQDVHNSQNLVLLGGFIGSAWLAEQYLLGLFIQSTGLYYNIRSDF